MVHITAAEPVDLDIPRLNTDNYRIWKELIILSLRMRGVSDYVDGTLKEPADEEEARIWQKNNEIAFDVIKGALDEVQLGYVVGIDGAKEAWDTLKRIYQPNDRARLRSLLAEFMNFKLTTPINEGASRLNYLQNEIGAIDPASRPCDSLKIEALFAGLGAEYDAALAAIGCSEETSYADVVGRLCRAERGMKARELNQR